MLESCFSANGISPQSGTEDKRMYRNFCDSAFMEDLRNIQWASVFKSTHTEGAPHEFIKLFSSVCDKHTAIKTLRLRFVKAPWLENFDERKRSTKNDCCTVYSANSEDWLPHFKKQSHKIK